MTAHLLGGNIDSAHRLAVLRGTGGALLRINLRSKSAAANTVATPELGDGTRIDVADDGRGLDVDAIRRKAYELDMLQPDAKVTDEEIMELILTPGFTTAGKVTQSAGRGVGMDVVANEVKKLGGSLRISSVTGQGTNFTVRLPFTLAITQALIVRTGDEVYALPLPTVEGVARLPAQLAAAAGVQVARHVARGDAHAAQCADGQVRKVLAHTFAMLQHVSQWRCNRAEAGHI